MTAFTPNQMLEFNQLGFNTSSTGIQDKIAKSLHILTLQPTSALIANRQNGLRSAIEVISHRLDLVGAPAGVVLASAYTLNFDITNIDRYIRGLADEFSSIHNPAVAERNILQEVAQNAELTSKNTGLMRRVFEKSPEEIRHNYFQRHNDAMEQYKTSLEKLMPGCASATLSAMQSSMSMAEELADPLVRQLLIDNRIAKYRADLIQHYSEKAKIPMPQSIANYKPAPT